MKLEKKTAEVYVGSDVSEKEAISRTTHLCIAAHQDDIEIMAYAPTVECYTSQEKWFSAVVVTDGAGSPRAGMYGAYTDDDMKIIRKSEQKDAAKIGRYSSQFLLDYSSTEVKDNKSDVLKNELAMIIEKCSPEVMYIHNLADKHDTHVAVAVRTIEAIRSLPKDKRPKKLICLEVWRSLDWVCDEQKLALDTSKHPNLAAALLGIFDSQIAGGKRYDLAAVGRRLANATFFASHSVDASDSVSYGIDVTKLIEDDSLSMTDVINEYIDSFKEDVHKRLGGFIR